MKRVQYFSILFAAVSLVACGSPDELPPTSTFSVGEAPRGGDPCALPKAGCPCEETGKTVGCGEVHRLSGDYLSCSVGERICGEDKLWGECVGDMISLLPPPTTGARPLALGDPEPCSANPCDPYCNLTLDTGVGILPPPDGFQSTDDGLVIEATEIDVEDGTDCTGLIVEPANQVVTVTKLRGSTGLRGEYFDRIDRSASEISDSWVADAERRDEVVNFSFGSGSPGLAGVGNDDFSIRWTGQLLADETDSFRIHTITDDGVRVWLNDSLIIDRWVNQGPTEIISNWLPLTDGEKYELRVEYYERGGGATAKLYWSTASRSRTIIPSTNLLPPAAEEGGFTTVPESVDYTATLVPEGCFDGIVEPAFTLDRFDAATFTEEGELVVSAAVAGELEVTAYVGALLATADVSIVVDVLEDLDAPAGSVEDFQEPTSGVDPATVLYPYDETVFPLGMQPPLIQYDDGGTAADAVKVSLRYPAGGSPDFTWAKISAETTPPTATIPLDAWKAFEQTAKGEDAEIVIQRTTSGAPLEEIVRSIRFAQAPVRGRIYYTQYAHGGSTKLMVADPGSASPAADAFGTSNGCPVCHSVSAQGNVVATSERRWSNQGGISEVLPDGTLNSLSDHPGDSEYKSGANDWRGFAWAPLTPDGRFALTGNNIWGNSKQSIVGIDTSTDTVDVPDSLLSGANGTGLLAEYFSDNSWGGTRWADYRPHVDFDFDAGGPGGPIGNDFTATYSGEVMAYFDEDYAFTVTSTGGIRLSVNGSVLIDELAYDGVSRSRTAVIPLLSGQKVPILLEWRDVGSDAELLMEWESPSTPYARVPVDQLFPADGLHGVVASFYNGNAFNTFQYERLEPDIDHNFGGAAPPGINTNNFSSRWEAQLEAPITGNIRLCVNSDDAVYLEFDGSVLFNAGGSTNSCSSNIPVTAGDVHDLLIEHREFTGNARIEFSWRGDGFSRTRVSGAYLTPPAGYVPPTTGLTATYYDGRDYRTALGDTPSRPGAMTTIVPNIDRNWGSNRPNYSIMAGNDSFSVRYTGRIQLPCDGLYEFENYADDASSVWIGKTRVTNRTSWGTSTGAARLSAGIYDFKYQVTEGSGGAAARLKWIPHCQGATSFEAIPEGAFLPTGGDLTAGFVRSGGDNSSNVDYWVWETPAASGVDPVDVTDDSPGAWGLSGTTMMVPSFSPAGDRLVFVDGDQGGGAGWRKGLSVFDFDQGAQTFTNRRLVLNFWPFGNVIKWPVFESDSRSVIYQSSTPVDWCCKGGWTRYGHMAPTNYFEIPGQLWSVDTESVAPVAVELSRLNTGERPTDANKVYQPTMLPESAGGYRWVVFTSTRPYGNTFNDPSIQNDYSDPAAYTPMVRNSELQSMLWVAAVNDEVSDGDDRSYPAFFLPNQNFSTVASKGYLNERGFWALDECRPTGSGDESSCEVDEDCCGGSGASPTAICRLDTPVSSPPTRHCQSRPSISECVERGGGCSESAECCLGSVCIGAECSEPPPLKQLAPVNFTRIYRAECERGTGAVWRFFDWQAVTPGDSYVEFYAQTASDPADFEDLPLAPDAVSSSNVIGVGSVAGPTVSSWVGNDVGALLDAASMIHEEYLQITMRFVPASDNQSTPHLTSWRQAFQCYPDQ